MVPNPNIRTTIDTITDQQSAAVGAVEETPDTGQGLLHLDPTIVGEHHVLFSQLFTSRCTQCSKELHWEAREAGIGNDISVYRAQCCNALFEARPYLVALTIKQQTIEHSEPLCKCGHEKSVHDRDHGCMSQDDTPGAVICPCWIFRLPKDEKP